jgi:hypothetical protein
VLIVSCKLLSRVLCVAQTNIHGIESLLIHLVLPRLGSPEADDVSQFVVTQLLEYLEGRKIGSLLVVDSDNVPVIVANLHVLGLSHVSAQALLDLSQDLTR